ncbi:MAG: hypothetical protein QNK20_03040 [Aureibaculum sp.]|nr:hypothetical protein [Aureibaculum sp.]
MIKQLNLQILRTINNDYNVRNSSLNKGLGWKSKRRLGYDRSTTKKVITFIGQLL